LNYGDGLPEPIRLSRAMTSNLYASLLQRAAFHATGPASFGTTSV